MKMRRPENDISLSDGLAYIVTAGVEARTRPVDSKVKLRRWRPSVPLSSKLHALQISLGEPCFERGVERKMILRQETQLAASGPS